MLRPGGYFLWSATPVYQKLPEDVEIWNGILLPSLGLLVLFAQTLYTYVCILGTLKSTASVFTTFIVVLKINCSHD